MAADVTLSLAHVSKRFRKGELYDSLRDLVPALTAALLRRRRPVSSREFWALRDVSFEVRRGEAFGVIGHNGAGKSTILKILSGIMHPTTGTLTVHGRLSALIEVGAGFHPDLTGRENVYLNGAILGMSRAEVRRKFDEIVAFAGLAEFIDTPVKRYSSGMYARLGFSVAAHVDPEVLIVDEVLSVGDHLFQRKCMEKMAAIVAGGATVIFVSHNLQAVGDLCTRCLLLSHGRVVTQGPTADVMREYTRVGVAEPEVATRPVDVSHFSLRGETGNDLRFAAGERVQLTIRMTAREPVRQVAVNVAVLDEHRTVIFATSSQRLGAPAVDLVPGETTEARFELTLHLGPGTYHVSVGAYRYDIQKDYGQFHGRTIFVHSDTDARGVANLYPRLVSQRQLAPDHARSIS